MGVIVREFTLADRAAAAEALEASGAFREEEIRVALDVLDEALDGGADGGYSLLAVESGGQFRGYVCAGSTPLTVSTWHVYWICVHPAAQGTGAGRALENRLEALVRSRGGERLVVETSGRPDYARARRFYEMAGYREVGRIPDFYGADDDCVLYCKRLA
jgi:ribosomal protein S18 acetylase RimI-like enzyme